MLAFSINNEDNDGYSTRVMNAINKNISYFKKFNPNWEEAVQRTFIAAVDHRNNNYEDIEPYIKKLARTIMRTKEVETPHDVYDDSGEVSYVFTVLSNTINEDNLIDRSEITGVFKELYLLHQDDFLKLQNVFKYDDVTDITDLKNFVVKNAFIKAEFSKLVKKFGGGLVFKVLYDFLKDLAQYTTTRSSSKIRDIVLKESNYAMLSKLPDVPCIVGADGALHQIDKNSLGMNINPDYIKWDVVFKTSCDVLKIDISPLMDYVYQEVFVEQGVNTRHIQWCGEKYKLTSPGGYVTLCVDRTKFIAIVRAELILNLLMNNINTVIALSPDSIFIKPNRALQLETLRLRMVTGKVLDLPVSIHLKKRLFMV